MDAEDFAGTPDRDLVGALDTPLALPPGGTTGRLSALVPLPWFPFTVAASVGAEEAAGRLARRTEHAYWCLRKVLRFTPRFGLLVLSREDWPRFAEMAAFGIPHLTADTQLVVGSEPAHARQDVGRELVRTLSVASLRSALRVKGAHPGHRRGQALRELATAWGGEIGQAA